MEQNNNRIEHGFESRWMSVELVCYVKTIIISFILSFVGGILWGTDRVVIIYSKCCITEIKVLALKQRDFYSVKTPRKPS